jgi:AcrR family transcriptional regulator
MSGLRSAGRPPGPHDDTLAKLLPAAQRLLLSEGGGALTPTRLHQETGVSRATIYRNWPSPADLVEAVLRHATAVMSQDPLGSGRDRPPNRSPGRRIDPDRDRIRLRRDLIGALDAVLARVGRDSADRCLLVAGLDYGLRSERVAQGTTSFVHALLTPVRSVVVEAIDGGLLDGSAADLVTELAAPVLAVGVIAGLEPGRGSPHAVVDQVLDRHLRHPVAS